jgi:hypothetical protein
VRVSLAAAFLVATLPCVLGCGVSGALGARWGGDAAATAVRLGAPCTEWSAWRGTAFEHCERVDVKKSVYGAMATLGFYRRGTQLVGLTIHFWRTRWEAIRAAACADLPLSCAVAAKDAYEIFWDDSLIRVEDDYQDGVVIVLAGPAFGNTYASAVLAEGLGRLFRFH